MRIARMRLNRFRGFDSLDLDLRLHTVVVGEARAGRSDIVQALRRVLDSRSTRARVNPLDVHRPVGESALLTEVEVTLLDLGARLEDLLDGQLELFDPADGRPVAAGEGAGAELGVRLCYRARYDFTADTGEHWVDFPSVSAPAVGLFVRVARVVREQLGVLFIDGAAPLQLRAEGELRALLASRDPDGLRQDLTELDEQVGAAAAAFSASALVRDVLGEIVAAGLGDVTPVENADAIAFASEDGTLATLLRALQPTVALGEAGALPLASHGSTLNAVMRAVEAIAAARRGGGASVIIGDDFGEGMDAAAAEHLSALIHREAGQTILTTRRTEVIRAFAQEELLRLTQHEGVRRQFRLAEVAGRAERLARRLALDQLLGAVTARTVVLVEGPHDAEGYGAVAVRLHRETGLRGHGLAGAGMRLLAPPGSDGGVTRLPEMARLALQLGFEVRAVVDNDRPNEEDPAVAELVGLVHQVVVLPPRTAVEAALVQGVPAAQLREAAAALQSLGLAPLPDGIEDEQVAAHIVKAKSLKKQNLHAAWVAALETVPPVAVMVIEVLTAPDSGRVDLTSSL